MDNWTVAAYILLLILLVTILILLIVAFAESLSCTTPKSEYTLISLASVSTDRNGETTVAINVYYRYLCLDPTKFPSAENIQRIIDTLLKSSDDLPATTDWGVVNRHIVEKIYKDENVSGVSVQIKFSNNTQSSIFNKGFIEPIRN